MHNRRSAVRTDLDRQGTLATPDGSIVRPCNLRNISSRGARVVIADHADLPDGLVLSLTGDTVSWPCRVVRREAGEVGVQFT